MSELHHAILLRDLSAQFRQLAPEPQGERGATAQFGSLAHELLNLISLEAATAALLIKRLRAEEPSDAAFIVDDLLELLATGRGQKWRRMGESFRRTYHPGLAGLCVQIEHSWKGRPQLPPQGEQIWQQTAGTFAKWLYDYILRLARAQDSA